MESAAIAVLFITVGGIAGFLAGVQIGGAQIIRAVTRGIEDAYDLNLRKEGGLITWLEREVEINQPTSWPDDYAAFDEPEYTYNTTIQSRQVLRSAPLERHPNEGMASRYDRPDWYDPNALRLDTDSSPWDV